VKLLYSTGTVVILNSEIAYVYTNTGKDVTGCYFVKYIYTYMNERLLFKLIDSFTLFLSKVWYRVRCRSDHFHIVKKQKSY